MQKGVVILFVLSLILPGQTAFAHNYRQLFGRSYQKAEQNAADLRPLLHQYAVAYHVDEKLMEAIIFPELMRYNRLFDAVETGSLMGLYSRFGADYANFSIGPMQMKPTFALSLETHLLKTKPAWAKQPGFYSIAITNTYDNRVARINRLDNKEWQVKYLIAMLRIVQVKHHTLWSKLSAEQKVSFAASAYNCGWDKPAQIIRSYISKPYYHLMPWDADEKYCFADVAVFRYRELGGI